MSTSSQPRTPLRQITEVLSRSLKQAFDEVCPERYGGPLALRRIDAPAQDPTVSFCLEAPSAIALRIDVTITHVGGNVYDLTTQVEDGDVRRFTYSEPAASGSSLSIAPYLGQKIARAVLDEVEQQLGKKLLQDQMVLEAA
jgi:hypothetical protein